MAIYLIAIASAMSLYYAYFWLSKPESLARSVWKTAPVALLLLAGVMGNLPTLMIAGLLACLAGDYFLSKEGDRFFLYGLGSFLLGHLFYIAFFSAEFDPSILSRPEVQQIAFLLLALAGMVVLRLWPYLKDMRIPVMVYALVIAAMAFFARLAEPGLTVLSGVVMFMISDILLANDRFTPLTNSYLRRAAPYLVWLLYIFGQAFIVLGLTGYQLI